MTNPAENCHRCTRKPGCPAFEEGDAGFAADCSQYEPHYMTDLDIEAFRALFVYVNSLKKAAGADPSFAAMLAYVEVPGGRSPADLIDHLHDLVGAERMDEIINAISA